jgi:hypothetical protein
MSLSSDLQRWSRREWENSRVWLLGALVLGIVLAIVDANVRLLIAPLILVVFVWCVQLIFKGLVAFLLAPLLGATFLAGPYLRRHQAKADARREMRKPTFEQL